MRKLWFRNKQLSQSHPHNKWQSKDLNPRVPDVPTRDNHSWNNWLIGEHYQKQDTAEKKIDTFLEHPNPLMIFFITCQKIGFFLGSPLSFIKTTVI